MLIPSLRPWSWLLLAWAALVLPLASACNDEPPPVADTRIDDGADVGTPDALDADLLDVAPDADEPDADVAMDVPEDVDRPDVPAPDADADRPDAPPDVPLADADVAVEDTAEPDADTTEPTFLRLLSVEPQSGPVTGGTEVFVLVDGELHEPLVLFGGRRGTDLRQVGPQTIVVTSPPGVLGPIDVKIVDQDAEDTLDDGFTYFAPLAIDAITPPRSTTEGGALVELVGHAFGPDVEVSMGGRAAIAVSVLDEQTIVALTPPHAAGLADVRVSNRYSEAVLEGGLEYFDRTELDQILPASGPVAGGNAVILIGRGFTASAEVTFAGVAASVRFVSANRLEVTVPAGEVGAADVEVRTGNGAAGLPRGYVYLGEVSETVGLLSVQPWFGPVRGGQEVVVNGFGFDADGLEVRFGGARAPLVEVLDAAVRVRTPAGTPGDVDVTVSNVRGSRTLSAGYRYLSNVGVGSVTPSSGPVEGGTPVALVGEGLTATTRFYFGPLEATEVVVVDATHATMVTPAGSLGLVDVRIVDGVQRASLQDGFRYTAPASVVAIAPTRGSIAGGTVLTVRGHGFSAPATVTMGRDACDAPVVIDQATIRCVTPEHREGAVEVKVGVGAEELTAPDRYVYYNPASRFGGAWGEPIGGAVNVSVFSISGSPVEGAFVMLTVDGDTDYRGFTDANGLITFSGADVLGEQVVSATAAGHSSSTVQAVDAENITLLLYPTAPPSGGGGGGSLPLATITGQVGGFQKIAEPGPDERQIIIVETTRESPWSGNPWPGNGNVVDPNGDRTYTLQSRIGDIAVVAIGGLVNDRTGIFTPYAYGIARFLFVSQDEVYVVNLDLEHELNQTLTIKLDGATLDPVNGPDNNSVTPWVDLGFEGVFGGWDLAKGTTSVIAATHQPRLEGPLSDATFLLYGGSFTGGGGIPYSVAVLRGVTEVDDLIEMPTLVGAPQPLVPVGGGVAPNGYVAFEPTNANRPDFWQIQIYQLPSTQVWEATLPGTQTWFNLPIFPDFSELPFEDRPTPYVYRGPLYMVISGAHIDGFDFDQHEYLNDLRRRDRWVSWTRTSYYVTLTE